MVLSLLVATFGDASAQLAPTHAGDPPRDRVAEPGDPKGKGAALQGNADKAGSEIDDDAAIDPELLALAREVGQEYRRWGRVDDEMRWAPTLCRMPMPSTGRISDAASGPHGRKLYYVYAKDRASYLAATDPEKKDRSSPVGQVIVKEAYLAVLCAEDETPAVHPTSMQSPLPAPRGAEPAPTAGGDSHDEEIVPGQSTAYAGKDGELMRAGDLHGLYIMARIENPEDLPETDEVTPPTDRGWIYATVAADGTVTGAGKMSKCIRCHEDAGVGRLFGMKPPQRIVDPIAPARSRIMPAGGEDG